MAFYSGYGRYNEYDDYDWETAPTPFNSYYGNYTPPAIKPRKDWNKINKENLIKACATKLNIFRSDCGFNVGAYNYENKETKNLNDFKGIISLCVGIQQNIPVIYFKGNGVLLITVPEAVDKYFNLKKTTKFKTENNYLGKNVITFVYALKVPSDLIEHVKMLSSSLLASLKAKFDSAYEIDLFTRYTPVSPVKLKNTLELNKELLDALLELAKQVKDFNKTLSARLDHYELIGEPNFKKYKIGKSIQKNLSINEPLTEKLVNSLSPDKKEAIERCFVTYKGLGMLSLDERRILEAVLILVSNSQIVYATEYPTSAQNFKVKKKVFLGKMIVNRHLKTATKAESLMNRLSQRVFLLAITANYTNLKTCVVTGLFQFSVKNDNYIFSIPPYIFKEILALKGSAFFVEREKGFYDSCNSKNSLSVYNLLDYLDYIRHQPNSDDSAVPMKASLKTLLQKMDLYKYREQGYKYIYEKFAAALSVAVKLKFMEDFSMTYEEFKEKLQEEDTCSLEIRVLKPPENDILNQKNSSSKAKMEVKNVKISG